MMMGEAKMEAQTLITVGASIITLYFTTFSNLMIKSYTTPERISYISVFGSGNSEHMNRFGGQAC
jgi:hypothetical protein